MPTCWTFARWCRRTTATSARFYQRRGFDLVAVHHDAVTHARAELKPSIPFEVDGIPLRHELELDLFL